MGQPTGGTQLELSPGMANQYQTFIIYLAQLYIIAKEGLSLTFVIYQEYIIWPSGFFFFFFKIYIQDLLDNKNIKMQLII